MQHFHSEPEPHSVYTDATASSFNTGAQTDTLDATEQRRLQESIEDYLDRVCRPLMDTLPYAARQELRREIAQHLHALVQAYRESGYAPALATKKALDKFGPPHIVAQQWNPVTAREGQYKRMERWFAGQWQGIAATLALCGVAGVLGLMAHYSGALSSHRLMPHSQLPVASTATPATPVRPLTYTAMADKQARLADLLAHYVAVHQAVAELASQQAALNAAGAELVSAQARMTELQVALQNADESLAHEWRYTPTKDILRTRRVALGQELALAQQRMVAQGAAVAQAEARLESIRSQMAQRGL